MNSEPTSPLSIFSSSKATETLGYKGYEIGAALKMSSIQLRFFRLKSLILRTPGKRPSWEKRHVR